MPFHVDGLAVLAMGVFAAVHSLAASLMVKNLVASWCGERARAIWYRPMFLLQSLACTTLLVYVIAGRSSLPVWSIDSPWAWGMRVGQGFCLLLMIDCARRVGFAAMLGVPGLAAWWKGQVFCPREPEAQGPRMDGSEVAAYGLFRWSRHPLNFLAIPLLWLQPVMTEAMLSACALATVYLVIGSWHEEIRLLRLYGAPYRRYRDSGVAFLVPWRSRKS
jgi:protein-S-isoprenylcysteine O-methyltransferase Ste14